MTATRTLLPMVMGLAEREHGGKAKTCRLLDRYKASLGNPTGEIFSVLFFKEMYKKCAARAKLLFSWLGTGHYLCRGGGEGKICWKDQNFCEAPPADHVYSKWPPSLFNIYLMTTPPPHISSYMLYKSNYWNACYSTLLRVNIRCMIAYKYRKSDRFLQIVPLWWLAVFTRRRLRRPGVLNVRLISASRSASRFYTRRLKRLRRLIHLLSASTGRRTHLMLRRFIRLTFDAYFVKRKFSQTKY